MSQRLGDGQGGALYRIDVAVGDEGTNTTIIVNYPW
jgi:hypothetical protein